MSTDYTNITNEISENIIPDLAKIVVEYTGAKLSELKCDLCNSKLKRCDAENGGEPVLDKTTFTYKDIKEKEITETVCCIDTWEHRDFYCLNCFTYYFMCRNCSNKEYVESELEDYDKHGDTYPINLCQFVGFKHWCLAVESDEDNESDAPYEDVSYEKKNIRYAHIPDLAKNKLFTGMTGQNEDGENRWYCKLCREYFVGVCV